MLGIILFANRLSVTLLLGDNDDEGEDNYFLNLLHVSSNEEHNS